MGAHNVGYQPNEVELAYVRKAYENSSAFITVCGGIQAALDAGVLKGKSATCPRFLLPYARKTAPDTKWEEKRWQRDGKLWTSGALLNGLDLIRAFGKEMWGGEGSLVNYWLEMGHFPERDVNYGDAPSKV
ncbi:hypothetical protein PV08_00252 [Exophiala spinifera]|uniref:DJ-1/PfpI domain-containing protein n=1 Tax=Exophiala spinifera TaxID=91928 RepID=A0A0D2BL40_9EURO|nr:uncharacterized protein PV08_00252 [Exophiala spinifera]KIW19678.1 hypothetical protein PV08_00252 [Exophiala spinifera]